MMNASLKHAKNIAQYLNKCNNTYIIHIALKELGISSSSEGFQYAKNTVRLLYEHPTATLTNGVYLAAGMISDPPAEQAQVEQAIRNAVKRAWKDRDGKVWNYYFPVGRAGRTECPSNRDFLMAVVDFVILWDGFCEEVNYERA